MDKNTPSFNLNVVVRETGIKPDTLRAWERRYGLPEPVRTEGGHRLYSTRDIDLIRWLLSRQKEGMRISQAVLLWREHQLDGVDPLNPSLSALESTPIGDGLPHDSALVQLRNTWIDACLAFDEIGADRAMAQALARYPVQMACTEVLQKGLSAIGNQWYQYAATVQQEHFASAVAAKRLSALIAAAPPPIRPERFLVGCPTGEEHTFSPLLTSLLLRYQGYQVTYLGANVPLIDLEKTVNKTNPDMVIFTAMQLDSAAALLPTANLLSEKQVRFGFGGRIFSIQSELQGVIPGFFLGEDLTQAAAAAASQALGGNVKGNPVFTLSSDYQAALQAFSNHRLNIAQRVSQHFSGTDFPVDYLEMINTHLINNVKSALSLGNLDYLNAEISWSETLIANHKIPFELVSEYLKVFHQHLVELGEEQLGLVAAWFSEKLEGLNKSQ